VLVVLGVGALARATSVDRRVRTASAIVAGLLALRALPFVVFVVLDLLGDRDMPRLGAFLDATYEPSRLLELAALACVFAAARSAGVKIRGGVAAVAIVAGAVSLLRGWLPVHHTYFGGEWRSLLFTAASIAVAAWGILIPLDAASRIDPNAEAEKEDPEDVTGRRVAIGLGTWLLAAALFVFAAIYLAAEKMPTWNPAHVETFASLFGAAGAIALVGPAAEVSRRRACTAAAIAWAAYGATLHVSVRFAQALLWDAMDGRDVAAGASVTRALALSSWVMSIAGVVPTSVTLHGFARHLRRELLARIALAASFPFVVGVALQLIRPGERPRAGWADLGFAGCSVLTFGMLSFVAYRILFPAEDG
jgi:hypothetical protein